MKRFIQDSVVIILMALLIVAGYLYGDERTPTITEKQWMERISK